MKLTHRYTRFGPILAVTLALLTTCPSLLWAKIGPDLQAPLGNPDGAVTDAASRTKFLIARDQFNLSYNDTTHQANWVSWSYSSTDSGSTDRTDAWSVEERLPSSFLRIGTSTFGTHFGIQWDRGHMTPSADRTSSVNNNAITFKMSNIIPQASKNNQGLWAQFETYCRSLATGGNEVLIMSGPTSFTGDRIPNNMSVPGSIWKIAVVVPNAASEIPANQRITTSSRVIAILTPNVSEGLGSWQSYTTSVELIEEITGLNFFTEVDSSTAIYLKNVVDNGSGPNSPVVITTFEPTLGPPGTPVEIYGYNFDVGTTIRFGEAQAINVTRVSANKLIAEVPEGATTGAISVSNTRGTDSSYEDFTVTNDSDAVISISTAFLRGFTSAEGSPSTAKIYAVNGTLLTGPVQIEAPAGFEISSDGSNFFPSLTLTPGIDGSLGEQISVRLRAGASAGSLSGAISHSSPGAVSRQLAVEGRVNPSTPYLTTSVSSLSGLISARNSAGAVKSYSLSGGNLTGNITVSAPSGFEVSVDNSTFGSTRTLSPSAGLLPPTMVYVRLAASAPAGAANGTITHSGGGASTLNLSVSGSVLDANAAASRIVAWDFTGEGSTNVTSNPSLATNVTSVADIYDSNLDSVNELFRGPDAKWSTGSHSFRTVGFKNDGISTTNSDFFEFALSSAPGVALSMSSIIARFAGTSSFFASPGVSNQFAYSTNGTNFTLIGTPIVVTNTGSAVTFDVSNVNALQNLPDNVTVTFRYYASGQTTTGGWGFTSPSAGSYGLDVRARPTANLPTPPVVVVSGTETATAYASYTYQITASNNPTFYAVSGLPDGLSVNQQTGLISGQPQTTGNFTVNLTAGNAGGESTAVLNLQVLRNAAAPVIVGSLVANAVVQTPFAYQINASNAPTFFLAASLPPGLSINTATGLISGTPTTGGTNNIAVTALNRLGEDSQTLQIIIRTPSLALVSAPPASFSSLFGSAGTPQSYTVTGHDLAGNVSVRAPEHFEISTDGVNFRSELTIAPNESNTLQQSILIRLAASAPPGLVSGTISHTATGATPLYIEITGNVGASSPTLLVSTESLEPFATADGTPSEVQEYEVRGAGLGDVVIITAPPGFEVGLPIEDSPGMFEFEPAIEFTPVAGILPPTEIYVRLRGDVAGSFSGVIAHSSAGAATQNIAVSGTVTAESRPNIIAAPGGSAYLNSSYSYTIQTDGSQSITSYGATGLPSGLSLNPGTGVISGTPTQSGTFNVTFSATNSEQRSSSTSYTLRVITTAEQPTTPTVVINKFHNATVDRVELLVTGDSIDGPPVDLRGMVIKDFNNNMATDGGGKYVFADHPLWSNVKAGTLIVLAAGNALPEDVDPADFVLAVNLANPTYFTEASGGFDLGNTEMVMIKPAGMQPDGVAGGMHALAVGTAGAQFNAFTGRKTRFNLALAPNRGYFCFVRNANAALADFYGSEARVASSMQFGQPSSTGNETFINNLRDLDQEGPIITILGQNPVNLAIGDSYLDAGATAFDVGDGASKSVTVSGAVNTDAIGTYSITYTAIDSKNNVGTAVRTVNVLTAEAVPPTVSTQAATAISATNATLHGEVDNQGSSAVTVRGFIYSTVPTTLEIGAEGATSITSGGGGGAFSAVLSPLSPGTTYYFRAFATNSSGTTYGAPLSFTTLKAEPLNYPENFRLGNVTSSSIEALWAATNADGYVLVVSSGVLLPPADGSPVADDTDVSDGFGIINLSPDTTSYAGFTGFAPGQTYTFSIYPFNNNGSDIDYKTGNAPSFSANLLTVPEIFVSGSPAPLTTTYGTPSTITSFTVSGVYLTGTVNVTAPTGFEVSAGDSAFGNSVTLSAESGTLSATTVYLRLAGTASVNGTYNGRTITIAGGGADPVTLATAAGGHVVSPKPLTITGLTAVNKVYDGTTSARVSGSPSYEGFVNNESFPVIHAVTWAFADKNVGPDKTLVRSGSFTAPNANYTIAAQPTLTAGITAKELTVSGATVAAKTYDGTTAATITSATLVGVVSGDTVTLSGEGTFDSPDAGENKSVTTSFILGGGDAPNYALIQPELSGTITKADQTITFAALPPKRTSDPAFELTATSSSGLSVTYTSSDEAVATVSGNLVTLLAAGETTITAIQPGDTNFTAAAAVQRTLVVDTGLYVVAEWDFQTTSNGGTAAAAPPDAPKVYESNFGDGTIYLDGSNRSSNWFVPASGTSNTEIHSFAGTSVNANGLMATSTSGTASLVLLGGSGTAANGKSAVFRFSMADRASLAVTFAAQRTTAGFDTQVWEYSTDGLTWSPIATIAAGTTSGTIRDTFANTGVLALPTITGLDNASNAYLRVTFNGATASNGNNRLDNIRLLATDYVAPDITPPAITVLGANPLTLATGTTFTDPGATAEDETDGFVSVTADGEVDTSTPGTYTVTYTAQDAAGNTAEATRTVIVVDLTPPVITLLGDNPFNVALNGTFTDPGATALDAVDGQVAVQTDTSAVNTALRGSYLVTYTATDAAGNIATATRTVQVGASNATYVLETEYGLSGADAAFTADPDQDGVPNLMEYAFGSDPSSATAIPAPAVLQIFGDTVRFTAVVRDADPLLTIRPLITSDPRQAWTPEGVVELENISQNNVPNGFIRRTWEITAPDPETQFIRYEVSYE